MISHRKLGYKIPQITLLLKNKEIISIQVAERLEFTMPEVSINKPSYIGRRRSSRFDNRNPKGTKQVPSIIEQEQGHYKIRASATFDDDTYDYDYDLNSMKYVENREQ
jgi:hypothetical protein